ncbi:MFS transporter [Bartonella sp. TP]|uniref:MFS transporter n=1 Tax=Bartonella sp. TP TaxID=3057550 RepID=UPI0025AFBE4B|nr:MFS transporter [Bartonella sp. TP]WJW79780.1 MFS transporter [Bartonella sp. TP]
MTITKNNEQEELKVGNFKAILIAASGNLIEWYDFYIYAATSIYFASQFFPSNGDIIIELLKSASVFFVGFLMRPIGGWLFGSLADKHGRRTSILIAISIMGLASFLTGLVPTYEHIGAWGALLLAILRMLQGLSAGGQYGSIAAYISEASVKGRRCFFSSFQAMTLVSGMLIASLVVYLLSTSLPEAAMRNWGWRIPFLLGGLVSILAFISQSYLHETVKIEDKTQKETGNIVTLFTTYKKTFLLVSGFTAAGSLTFYTFTTYMRTYLFTTSDFSKSTAQAIVTGALFVYMICLPLFGWLGDKIGTRACLRIWTILSIITIIPLLNIIGRTHNSMIAFACIVSLLWISSLYYAVSNIVKAEMYPRSIRALGVNVSHAVANALFGGSASMVALYFKDIGYGHVFGYYVTFMMIIAAISSWLMPDARTYSDLYK